MGQKLRREIEEIEDAQVKLRESIEQTKELAEDVDKLLKKHKKSLKEHAEN